VESITRDDLFAFHKRWFFPGNFVVTASGDFDRAEMVQKLEKLFADWPWTGTPPPPIPQDLVMAEPGVYLVNKDVNQGRVVMQLPGIMRSNPDYFPLIIMNDILGGGGFTSRLVNRVRSDEGLAYAVSSFSRGSLFPVRLPRRLPIQVRHRGLCDRDHPRRDQTHRRRTGETDELESAKRGFIDRLPRSFASKAQIVAVLAGEEFTGVTRPTRSTGRMSPRKSKR
jgi:zinc protease